MAFMVLAVAGTPVSHAQTGSSSLVISAFYPSGGLPGSYYNKNFVEITNISNASVSLLGKSFQHAIDNNTFGQKYDFPDVTLAPGQSFLLEGQGYSQPNGSQPLPPADDSLSFNLSLFSGQLAIVNSTTLLTCGATPCLPNPDIIDFVGYYFVNNYEGDSALPVDFFTSPYVNVVRRLANGCVDTNQNPFDFEVLPVSELVPRNTTSTPAQCLVVPSRTQIQTEEGGVAAYGVRLQAAPSSDVQVAMPTVPGLTFSPSSLIFTPQNWATQQTVAAQSSDNSTINAPITYTVIHTTTSLDAAFNGLSVAPVSVLITDNDSVNVLSEPQNLNITEGQSATYTVQLTAQPTATVEMGLFFYDNDIDVTPVSVTFTSENWNVPQTITVSVPDNFTVQPPFSTQIGYALTSTDPNFNAPTPIDPMTLFINNNDVSELIFSPDVVEGVEGTSQSFTIRLGAQPTADVTLNHIDYNTAALTIAPEQLIFTDQTWNVPQTVTYTFVDDSVYLGRQSYATLIASTSADGNYDNRFFNGVGATVFDNDPLPSNLLKNSSFENPSVNGRQYAEHWDVFTTNPGDRRSCARGALSGACFLRFSSGTPIAATRGMAQSVDTFGQWGQAGDTFNFAAQVQGINHVGGMRMVLTLVYTDGTNERNTLLLPNGTYAYRQFIVSRVASKPVRTVFVSFEARNQSGGIRIDRARLRLIPGTAGAPLPLPDPQ
jgi:hypothetical protein